MIKVLCFLFAVCAPIEPIAPVGVSPELVSPEILAPLSTEEAFLEMAVPFVERWEGMELKAYQDIVGVWTICAGHTEGVYPGQVMTLGECRALLRKDLLQYRAGLHKYFTHETITTRLPVTRDTALVSLAYNVGIAGAGKSTATRRLNAGDISGCCEALTWWNKAGGRIVRGLVKRRGGESELCLA